MLDESQISEMKIEALIKYISDGANKLSTVSRHSVEAARPVVGICVFNDGSAWANVIISGSDVKKTGTDLKSCLESLAKEVSDKLNSLLETLEDFARTHSASSDRLKKVSANMARANNIPET